MFDNIKFPTKSIEEELTEFDIRKFDTLINSIVTTDTHIQYEGHAKRLNQNDPFYTIMNTQTWDKKKKVKYEKYIKMRFKSPDAFNDFCQTRTAVQLYQGQSKKLSFSDDDDFNLIFIRNGIHLDCYGYDNKNESKQIKYICSSSNKKNFEDGIVSYLRYFTHLKSIVGISDSYVLKVLKSELNKGLLIYDGKVKQISNYFDTYCLAYIPVEHFTKNNKQTPAWDLFLSQFNTDNDRKLFRAWIFGVFVENDFNRQILWVEGEGYTGKSTVASAIGEILSSYNPYLFNSIKIDTENNKINLVNFDKCRFVVFSNAILDSNLLHREEILLLTGNDYTTVKKLYHDPENKKLFSKIMINSNFSPIYNDKIVHESTRMIHLKMCPANVKQAKTQWGEHKLSFNERLKKEFEDFMRKARIDYKELMQHNGLLKI
jgi:hypothetical protein